MALRNYANEYTALGNQQRTSESTPENLIVMLYEKLCVCLKRTLMLPIDRIDELELDERLRSIEDYHKQTGKALQILVTLRELLDLETGGEVAKQLNETYRHLANSLWKATREKDLSTIDSLFTAISELRDAWRSVS